MVVTQTDKYTEPGHHPAKYSALLLLEQPLIAKQTAGDGGLHPLPVGYVSPLTGLCSTAVREDYSSQRASPLFRCAHAALLQRFVLVLAGRQLIFFIVTYVVLPLGFVMETGLVTYPCFSYG